MSDLIEWLTAILDEDERLAKAAAADAPPPWSSHDPRAVLADIAAKRQIIELHELTSEKVPHAPFDPYTGERREQEFEVNCMICGWVSDDQTRGCPTLHALASAYAHRLGYREDWRPADA